MNGQMNKLNKVHDWGSSPPLLSTFQVRQHSPELSPEHVVYKSVLHIRTKNGKCLWQEIQSVKAQQLLIQIWWKPTRWHVWGETRAWLSQETFSLGLLMSPIITAAPAPSRQFFFSQQFFARSMPWVLLTKEVPGIATSWGYDWLKQFWK